MGNRDEYEVDQKDQNVQDLITNRERELVKEQDTYEITRDVNLKSSPKLPPSSDQRMSARSWRMIIGSVLVVWREWEIATTSLENQQDVASATQRVSN